MDQFIPVKTRKAALNQMPWASWIIKVYGGYHGFEYLPDYKLFMDGKYNKKHEIAGRLYRGCA